MKPKRKSKVSIALAFAAIPILSGCGANNSAPPVATIPAPITPGVGLPGGCIPVNQSIGFNGTNVFLDGANIDAGAIPGMQAYGTVGIGAAPPATTGFNYSRQGVDGSIGFNATNVPTGVMPGTYPSTSGGNGATINGVLTISSATQQDILYKFGGYTNGGSYPNYNPYATPGTVPLTQTQVCVSGMAIQSFITTSGSPRTLYNGNVYLYMNNTQHGYVLYF